MWKLANGSNFLHERPDLLGLQARSCVGQESFDLTFFEARPTFTLFAFGLYRGFRSFLALSRALLDLQFVTLKFPVSVPLLPKDDHINNDFVQALLQASSIAVRPRARRSIACAGVPNIQSQDGLPVVLRRSGNPHFIPTSVFGTIRGLQAEAKILMADGVSNFRFLPSTNVWSGARAGQGEEQSIQNRKTALTNSALKDRLVPSERGTLILRHQAPVVTQELSRRRVQTVRRQ